MGHGIRGAPYPQIPWGTTWGGFSRCTKPTGFILSEFHIEINFDALPSSLGQLLARLGCPLVAKLNVVTDTFLLHY